VRTRRVMHSLQLLGKLCVLGTARMVQPRLVALQPGQSGTIMIDRRHLAASLNRS